MWFSLIELKKFYESQQLDPNSQNLDFKLRYLRKHIEQQSADTSYLLKNIEIHAVRLLTALQVSRALTDVSASTDREQQIEYIKENLKFSLPLCRDSLVNKNEMVEVINSSSGKADLFSPSALQHYKKFLEDDKKIARLTQNEQKEFNQICKHLDLKILLAQIISNMVLEEKMLDSWQEVLPFYFFAKKYIEMESNYYLERMLTSWKIFRKHQADIAGIHNIYEMFDELSLVLQKLQKRKAVSNNALIKSEISHLLSLISQEPDLLEYIQTELVRNCAVAAYTFQFIQVIGMYSQETELSENLAAAIERDISDFIRGIKDVSDELSVHLNIVYDYLASLSTFFKYSAIEKLNHHQRYLRRFRIQGLELFYHLMVTDIFIRKLPDPYINLDNLFEEKLTIKDERKLKKLKAH